MSDQLDERIAAWLDGALSDEEAAVFEQELERNPDLARRAADWKANDAFITSALSPVADAQIDAHLLARMGLAQPVVEPLGLPVAANDNPSWWRRHALPLGGGLAASLAAILLLTTPNGTTSPDALSVALETTPSLQQVVLADGRKIEPTLTVRAADGRWCREFRTGGETGLACRDKNGWKVEATVGKAGPAASSEIGLAAGADASALDATYRRLGASDPLGADAEASLIKKGWGDH